MIENGHYATYAGVCNDWKKPINDTDNLYNVSKRTLFEVNIMFEIYTYLLHAIPETYFK